MPAGRDDQYADEPFETESRYQVFVEVPNQELVHEHETDWAVVTLTLESDPLQVIVGTGGGVTGTDT